MENLNKQENNPTLKEGVEDMVKVLICTLYNADPVLLACNKLGPNRLILLIDKKPDDIQKKSLKLIKDSIGRTLGRIDHNGSITDNFGRDLGYVQKSC